ncbi:uncharacterized protein LAJ45_07343 [Morchella importuna]|uniref:uncharacterized protein n=1 Tax=Morchella importuna TaxID=1174673 RepID=UPI001E8D8ACA|nr:uncharacterized protein LAJ45_07343 [Morchella importuna]KAH8148632.1 hypothetical protein LAJ45_07343 [Morchella importuna]
MWNKNKKLIRPKYTHLPTDSVVFARTQTTSSIIHPPPPSKSATRITRFPPLSLFFFFGCDLLEISAPNVKQILGKYYDVYNGLLSPSTQKSLCTIHRIPSQGI